MSGLRPTVLSLEIPMMNFILNAIVVAALIGTFLLAPAPTPRPSTVASQPAEAAVVSPAIDSAGAKVD